MSPLDAINKAAFITRFPEPDEILDLASVCERLRGPSGEVDVYIQAAKQACIQTLGKSPKDQHCTVLYTSSLDAAMKINDWPLLNLSDIEADGMPYASFFCLEEGKACHVVGSARTLPLTVCAASLRSIALDLGWKGMLDPGKKPWWYWK